MPSCVGDAMPSVAGYYEQEFLVARCFAFLHVLTIFFGLFVDAASRDGSAAEVCVDSCAAPTRLTCMCVCGKKKQLKKKEIVKKNYVIKKPFTPSTTNF